MPERLKQILQKITDWWKKFTIRQRTIIVSVTAVTIVAAALLFSYLTRDQYVTLMTCDSTKEASEVKDLLDGDSIKYKISTDGLKIDVLSTQQSDANLLLGANNIPAEAYSIDNVTSGSFSTTESDKQKKYVLYLESQLANDFIGKFKSIKNASVELNIPVDDGTLISTDKESYASVLLELKDDSFTQDNAAYMARAIATAIGNKTTDNIVIMDTDGNMLFTGDSDTTTAGLASSQLSTKAKAESQVKSEVTNVLLGTNEFDKVQVASNLALDFSDKEETVHNYEAADGQTQGVLSHSDEYSSDNTSGTGGEPGTGSNTENDTTYVMENNSNSNSSVNETQKDYLPKETITKTNTPSGTINYGNSSVAVTAITYNVVREDDAKKQGLLQGVTWDQYKLANSKRTKEKVDDDILNAVSKATGIATANIAIVAYKENVFFDSASTGLKLTDIVQIILIAVILGLLAFVIMRSMKKEKQEEPEQELSVENLLESTPQESLENISVEEESETKKLVGRFVDENPEAAANLLRNWLNEE
jgi:flagellar M-ring protein FliF